MGATGTRVYRPHGPDWQTTGLPNGGCRQSVDQPRGRCPFTPGVIYGSFILCIKLLHLLSAGRKSSPPPSNKHPIIIHTTTEKKSFLFYSEQVLTQHTGRAHSWAKGGQGVLLLLMADINNRNQLFCYKN